MKDPNVIISRLNPFFNFGEIVDVLSYNEFTECLLVKSGRSHCGEIHYSEAFPCNEMYDYEKLNKAIEYIEKRQLKN